MKYLKVTVNGKTYEVQVEEMDSAPSAPVPQPVSPGPTAVPAVEQPSVAAKISTGSDANAPIETSVEDAEVVQCPMPGTILSVHVQVGDDVKKGDVLLVFEAMKMENEIQSPRDAKVVGVHVHKNDSVEAGRDLISLK